jgi:Glycosyl transferase family 2
MAAPGEPQPENPVVSVVIATYNRPDVLAAAIRSVLAQRFEDWELLVVGDHCDGLTGETVLGFGDPRIRYMNLAFNHGDQSGPNNVGMARARGRYIALLNHDDLWFPDHLVGALDFLEASGADLVIARCAGVMPPDTHPHGADDWWILMRGTGRGGRYDPVTTIAPASSLLFKAEVVAKVGPWRPAIECYLPTSREWLFRVWRSGFVMKTWPHLTVLNIPSGNRTGSYRQRASPEHAFFEPLMSAPTDLRLLLLDPSRALPPRLRWRGRLVGSVEPILRSLARLGIPPSELLGWLDYRLARGQYINGLRKTRGLDPIAERDPSSAELLDRYRNSRQKDRHDDPAPLE